jgi:hypothetical protein
VGMVSLDVGSYATTLALWVLSYLVATNLFVSQERLVRWRGLSYPEAPYPHR